LGRRALLGIDADMGIREGAADDGQAVDVARCAAFSRVSGIGREAEDDVRDVDIGQGQVVDIARDEDAVAEAVDIEVQSVTPLALTLMAAPAAPS
jgi:hypothetical protein